MAHIFKPGDKVYFHARNKWVTLKDASTTMIPNLLELEGEGIYIDPTFAISLINPFDISDPNNPPEFRWPFFLNGRPVGIGDELILKQSQESLWVTSLIYGKDNTRVCGNPSFGYFVLIPENFYWPDELPVKKKVADWVYTYTRYWGEVWVEFAKGLTEEEVNRLHGASGVTIKMIPGTEREVEG